MWPPITCGRADDMAVIELAIGPGPTPGIFQVEVVASRVGEAKAAVELDAESILARRGMLQKAVLASSVSSRRALSEFELPVREVGEALFTSLLGTREVAGRYQAAAAAAAMRGEGLRIVLRIDSPTLAGLPWEAMYDPEAQAYVCRQAQLVRRVPVASVPSPLNVRPPLRILGVVSSPRGLTALDVEKEQDELARALERAVESGLVEVHWPLTRPGQDCKKSCSWRSGMCCTSSGTGISMLIRMRDCWPWCAMMGELIWWQRTGW